jgi:putative hemolysin
MDFLVILLLILLNGIFAMAEMALAASRKVRLKAIEESGESGSKGARTALALLSTPTEFLSTIQIGITSIGVLNGIVGEAAFSERLTMELVSLGVSDTFAPLISTATVVTLITLATILFGELVPKRIAQLHPERVASLLSGLMRVLLVLSRPLVHLLSSSTSLVLKLLGVNLSDSKAVTEEEINASLDEGVSAGLIEDQEHLMVKNVFHLDQRQLTSMMVPRADIVWLDAKLTSSKAIEVLKEQQQHSWYPVCRNSLDDVIGVVGVNQLIANLGSQTSLEEFVLPVAFVPETLTGLDLLEQFQNPRAVGELNNSTFQVKKDMGGLEINPNSGTTAKIKTTTSPVFKSPSPQGVSGRLVLIVDEYGVLHGLITPRDILEAITGELLQSSDPGEVWATLLSDNSWLLDGLMPIQELKSRLEIDELPLEDKRIYNTLAGLIMAVLGRLPSVGDTAKCGHWKFEVKTLDERRIDSVIARKIQQ